MNCSIVTSVFFLVAELWITLGMFFYPKKKDKAVGCTWMIAIIVLLNCFHVLTAAIMTLARIPVNIVSAGVLDFLMGSFFWYVIIRKKQRQHYTFHWMDAVTLTSILGIVVYITKVRYRGLALWPDYLTIDPVSHFREAMDLVHNQSVTSMFYEFVWNGYLIELLGPFLKVDYYYRIFVLSDVIGLVIAGMAFYGAAQRFAKTTFLKICAAVMSVIYLVGYPLNSTLFGFVYLGMGVTLIIVILIFADFYMDDEMPKWMNISILMLLCLGLFECYVLFMPITYVALILCVFVKQKKAKKLISWDTIFVCLAVFLLPCMIGFWFTYRSIFQGGVTVASALTNEGAAYRNLYSDFLLFLPPVIVGYIMRIKNKDVGLMMFYAPLTLGYTLYMFFKVFKGTASTYYYYKLNYLIWFVIIWLALEGICRAKELQGRLLAIASVCVWLFTAFLVVEQIEERMMNKNSLMVDEIRSDDFNHIVAYNHYFYGIPMPCFADHKLSLYHYVYDNILPTTDKVVPMAGYWEDDLWYQAITDQRYYGWGQSDPNHEDYFAHLNEANPDYILVMRESQIYVDEHSYFDSLESVYDNDFGYIAKFKPYGEE